MSDTAAPESNMLAAFKELSAIEQAAFMRQAASVHEKTVAAALKAAGIRKRLTPEERAPQDRSPWTVPGYPLGQGGRCRLFCQKH